MEFTAIRDDGHQVVTFTPTVILCVILRIGMITVNDLAEGDLSTVQRVPW